jgi:AcrR family transcriptional regulator
MAETLAAGAPARPLRADAERNRRRILDAARAVFADRGLDAPLEDIAERAGVGIATLYRRFATREDLVMAVFCDTFARFAELAEEALRAPTAWTGFCHLVERVCALQAADRGSTDVLILAPSCERAQAHRSRGFHAFTHLVRRAQEEGTLREDFAVEDFVLLLIANASVVQATREAAPHAWRRFVALMLDSYRASHDGPLPAAPTPIQTERILRHIGPAKGLCPGHGEDRDVEHGAGQP